MSEEYRSPFVPDRDLPTSDKNLNVIIINTTEKIIVYHTAQSWIYKRLWLKIPIHFIIQQKFLIHGFSIRGFQKIRAVAASKAENDLLIQMFCYSL